MTAAKKKLLLIYLGKHLRRATNLQICQCWCGENMFLVNKTPSAKPGWNNILFQTTMIKIHAFYKTAQKPYPLGRTYPYNQCKGAPRLPRFDLRNRIQPRYILKCFRRLHWYLILMASLLLHWWLQMKSKESSFGTKSCLILYVGSEDHQEVYVDLRVPGNHDQPANQVISTELNFHVACHNGLVFES